MDYTFLYDNPAYVEAIIVGIIFGAAIGAAGGWFIYKAKNRNPKTGALIFGITGFVAGMGGYVGLINVIVFMGIVLACLWFLLPALKKCPTCGELNDSKAAMCKRCGNPLYAATGQAPVNIANPTVNPGASGPAQAASQPKPHKTGSFTTKPGGVFVSYRRSDSAEITGRIYDQLVARFGKENVFKDVDSIPFGVDFRDYLKNVVGGCGALIAVIGPEWVDAKDEAGQRRLDDPADYVRIEIESALARNIPVIPLLVRNATLPKEIQLPEPLKPLAYRNAANARNDPDFHPDMDRLIKSLEKTIGPKS